jgi:hypothetical protein
MLSMDAGNGMKSNPQIAQIAQIFIRVDGEAGAKRHPPNPLNPRSIFTTG